MMVLVIVGMIVGLLSGMFGIGGGTVIVPALVWLGLSQRHAAATSMLAIVPTALSGVISYAHNGNVDWVAARCCSLACSPADSLVAGCCRGCQNSYCGGCSWCF